MDQQPPVPPQNSSLFQLNLDAGNSYALKSAASWARVLAVVGFICGILFVIMGILVQNSAGGRYRGYSDYEGSGSTAANIGMAVYVITGIILIISSIFALNFANKISRALRANDQYSLSSGFAAVRNYFAFWAILMILSLLLMLIGVAGIAMNSK